MGSYTIGVYTDEQQARLGVDEAGKKLAKPFLRNEAPFLCVAGQKFFNVDDFAKAYSLEEAELPLFIVGK
jgi:hypothetical protein